MENTERIWDIHDPHIFRDDATDSYYVYSTEGKIHKSKDLIHWMQVGTALKDFPKEATEWTGTTNLWAPDIIKVGKEYRLYCSNSAWGVRKSCIFLAVADRPEGPFRYRGIVVRSDDEHFPCNAIDANPVEEDGTGRQFMTYGSFWGGVYLIELNPETGLAKEGPDVFGRCIAARPDWMDAAIEGPYIRYNKATGYYYLFVSYGSLLSDYNIRVGRSREITGPYVDLEGRDLAVPNWNNALDVERSGIFGNPDYPGTCIDPNNEIGYLLCASYIYENRDSHWHGIMGPGHNSVLEDSDGSWYLIHHARPLHYTHGVPSFMQVRKMFWMENGWPVVAPVAYNGDEQLAVAPPTKKVYEYGRAEVGMEDVAGIYRYLELKPESPQLAKPMSEMILYPDGTAYYARTIRYTWTMENVTELTTPVVQGTIARLKLSSIGHSFEAYLMRGYDAVLDCETVYFSGMSSRGCGVWGVKLP